MIIYCQLLEKAEPAFGTETEHLLSEHFSNSEVFSFDNFSEPTFTSQLLKAVEEAKSPVWLMVESKNEKAPLGQALYFLNSLKKATVSVKSILIGQHPTCQKVMRKRTELNHHVQSMEEFGEALAQIRNGF